MERLLMAQKSLEGFEKGGKEQVGVGAFMQCLRVSGQKNAIIFEPISCTKPDE